MTRRTTALMLSLGLVLAVPASMGAVEPLPDSAPGSTVWLKGPFGAVIGTNPDEPATAAPDARPLDTWTRGAALELAFDPPLVAGDSLSLTSTMAESDQTVELPLEDGRWVTGPNEAGVHLVVATVESAGGDASEHAWLLEVPDRPGDWETLLEMPAIEASVSAASGAVLGVRGHGCYVGMCQEAGYRPPTASLQALTVAVDEPLQLQLDDGSALVYWEGRLEPQPGTRAETRLANMVFDAPVAAPLLTGLEPDRPGEWLLELRVDYDRERGWQWYLFRLIAE